MSAFALVTGASTGIGLEFARRLGARGVNLVLASRNLEKLEKAATELAETYNITALAIQSDLSVLGSAEELVAECDRRGIEIDILVNNAGMGMFGESTGQNAARIEGLLTLNVTSLTTLSSVLGAKMKARGHGYILNVGSVTANMVTPLFASYAASKRYVYDFSMALHTELRGSGVSVTCLQPGFVKTDFDANALIENASYLAISDKSGHTPEKVAAIGIRAMYKKRRSAVVGIGNSLVILLGRLVPANLTATFIKKTVSWLTR